MIEELIPADCVSRNGRGKEPARPVEIAYLDAAKGLACAVEAKDSYTGSHIERVSRIAVELAKAMGISGEELRAVELGAILHDVGKIGIDSQILTKPGELTDDEIAEMRRHPIVGSEMLGPSPFLDIVRDCVRHHHERFDGNGYPSGLRGTEISLFARIVSVADAYDAMTSDRCYRPGMQTHAALAELRTAAGTQLDPEIVEVFVRIHDELLALLPLAVGAEL